MFRKSFFVPALRKNFKTLTNAGPPGLEVGATDQIERTITAEDVEAFARLTGDTNPIHLEEKDGSPVVHGALLNGLVSALIGTRLPGEGTVVIAQSMRFPRPCFVGDTVEVRVEITRVRKIITCTYAVVRKRDHSVLMDGDAKLVLKKL